MDYHVLRKLSNLVQAEKELRLHDDFPSEYGKEITTKNNTIEECVNLMKFRVDNTATIFEEFTKSITELPINLEGLSKIFLALDGSEKELEKTLSSYTVEDLFSKYNFIKEKLHKQGPAFFTKQRVLLLSDLVRGYSDEGFVGATKKKNQRRLTIYEFEHVNDLGRSIKDRILREVTNNIQFTLVRLGHPVSKGAKETINESVKFFIENGVTTIKSDDKSLFDFEIKFNLNQEPPFALTEFEFKKEHPYVLDVGLLPFISLLGARSPDMRKEALPSEHGKYNRNDLTADQLALLRELDKRGVEGIKSSDLRKLPFALNNPVLKKILDENSIITKEVILKYTKLDFAQNPNDVVHSNIEKLRSKLNTGVIEFKNTNQRIFLDKKNYSFVLSLDVDDVASALYNPEAKYDGDYSGSGEDDYEEDPYDDDYADNEPDPDLRTFLEKYKDYVENTAHPTLAQSETMTIGWVRFTRMPKNDIWIDEVQTDLTKILPESVLKGLGGLNGITKLIMETFISTLRSHGAQKFYMPDLEFREEEYRSSPPPSIYTELPKKFRFKLNYLGNTELAKESNDSDFDEYLGRKVWVLSSFDKKEWKI